MRSLPVLAFLLAATASTAHADPTITPLARSCAEVADDQLDAATHARAVATLARVLERADLFVVDRDCTEVYRIQNAPDGDLVVLIGPGARVTARRTDHPPLGELYSELLTRQRRQRAQAEADAAALQVATAREAAARTAAARQAPGGEAPAADAQSAEEPIANDTSSVAPAPEVATADAPNLEPLPADTATGEQPAPPPPENLFYARLGFGAVNVGTNDGSGGTFGVGVRLPAGRYAVDFSLGGIAGVAIGLKAEAMTLPEAGRTGAIYGGAGLSASKVSSTDWSAGYMVDNSGGGIGAELSAGVMIERQHRAFIQADMSLPFYTAGDAYPVMFTLSLGFGLKHR
ncbi:MAG TPA: hypothetical protein VLB44_00780 [Kofleriaceae bacterium]|nr:hypothetical protein [Kofleriaceae bacterium]